MAKGVFKNNKFRGFYEGKNLFSYRSQMKDVLDYNNTFTVEDRIEKVNQLLNLDDRGSKDEFWQEVWDTGICKSALNTSDGLWSETDVCGTLESLGTYILAKAPKDSAEKITLYDDYKLFKRAVEEKEKINPVCEDSGDGLLVYKKMKNFKLAPKYECKLSEKDVAIELYGNNFTELGKFTITYSKDYKSVNYKKDVILNVVPIESFKDYKKSLYKFPRVEIDYSKDCAFNIEDELFIPKLDNVSENYEEDYKSVIRYLNKCKFITSESDLYKYPQIRSYYELLSLFNSMTCSTSNLYRMVSDKIRNDYCKYLNEDKFLNTEYKITDSKLYSVCKNNLPLLKDDMLMYKESKERPIVFKCPLKDSGNEIDWSYLDMFNVEHVKALLQLRQSIDICEDAMIDLDELVESSNLDDDSREMLKLWSSGKTQEHIGELFEISKQAVNKKIERICNSIMNEYERQYEDKYYYLFVVKGEYKKCSKCGEIKLVKRFDKNGKRGYMSMCKECRK